MRSLVALVLGLGIVGSAQAADLPVKAPRMPVEPVFNWSGAYIGAHLGGAWSRTTGSAADLAGIAAAYGAVPAPRGIFGGGQIGYNWQLPNNFVFGLEAAGGAGPGFNQEVVTPTTRLLSEGRWYAMLGGRVGYAAGQWMPYVAGGVAWAGNHVSARSIFGTSDIDNTHLGFHVGGGIEYAVARNWTVGVDYRYFSFEKKVYGGVSTGSDVSAVTGRVNYRF